MDLREISFCDKIVYNITNDKYKELIVNKLKDKKINICQKINYYNDKIHKKELLENEYIFSYKSKGNNYILFCTKINNKNNCFFIDRKINKGYVYPRILLVHYRFSENIYNDTILFGELLLDKINTFYFTNILYYSGYSLYKYNIYDKLNNIKKILVNDYISDNNIEPCELKIKKYYNLNKIDIKKNISNITGIEFISYNGNKSIFYNLNKNIKKNNFTNKQKINNKIMNNNKILKISKTNNIDIYNLYCIKKNSLYNLGIARIDSNNSSMLYDNFKNKDFNYKLCVECKYNKFFNKWIPLKIINNNSKIDDFFEIRQYLNNI